MPTFDIRVTGLDHLQEQLDALPENLDEAITRGLEMAAAEAVQQIDEEISQSYPPASLPGEPPALRTGTLLRSVRIDTVEPLRVTIAVGGSGTMAPYASWLEFGTSKMAPRPFVQPIVIRVAPEVGNIVLEEVNSEIKKAV